MNKVKITAQKCGSMNEADRLELLRLLGKSGYTVRIVKERPSGKSTGAYIYSVEYWEE